MPGFWQLCASGVLMHWATLCAFCIWTNWASISTMTISSTDANKVLRVVPLTSATVKRRQLVCQAAFRGLDIRDRQSPGLKQKYNAKHDQVEDEEYPEPGQKNIG